jgi:phosphoinositide-3-kinase regulatory subunit 4
LLTKQLALVTVVSPTNSYIFPEYILPKLQPFSSNTNSKISPWVRATYASCLGSLASSASHFLECQQMLKSRTNVPFDMEGGSISRSSYQSLFDIAREDLISQFETHAKALLTDPDVSVRRSLLPSVATLCVFFGNQKAGDVVLGHLNTYLNDNDWLLKSDFFERIVGVAAYIGTSGLEEFILPLMVQSLTDPEEAVVEKVIRSFTAIADLGIFHRPSLWELVEIVARFTMHPNIWIREAAARFISAAAKYASIADRSAIITPLIKDYMTVLPAELTESVVLDCLKKSLPRLTLEMASGWAAKDGSGGFWNTAANGQLFVFGFGDGLQIAPAKPSNAKILNRLAKTDEDESWVKRLRHAGMTAEDEIKLVALQEYIWRSTRRRNQETVEKETPAAGIIPLKDLDVSLQLVFFDNQKAAQQVKAYEREEAAKLRTIAEALQDATSTSTAPDRQATGPRDIPGAVLSPTDSQPHSPIERVLGSPNPEVSSLDSRLSLRVDRPITRKGSAINLMLGNNRDAAAKATAEISTDTTNVFGKVENRQHKADEAKKRISPLVRAHDNRLTVSGRPLDPVHTYIGSDPTVLKLLDSLYADNYPLDLIEFGQITPLQRTEPRRRGAQAPAIWRPEGALVALLAEHTAPINRVAIAPDHRFFITGSDDGTVRVWDSGRLERNVSQRSRLVHPQGHDVRVTALTFVRGTHCFASGGSDGSVHVVRVDCTDAAQSSSSSAAAASMAAGAAAGGGGAGAAAGAGGVPAAGTRYTRMSLVRKHQLPAGEHAVWLEHHHTESASTLLVATNASAVHGVDLRTMATAFTLRCPPRHGAPTCLCVDRAGQWLLVGTARGALHLWDLRFRLRLRSWRFEAGGAIHKLVAPALRGSRKFRVAVAGGTPGCVVMLDVERGVIKQVFRTPPGAGTTEEPPPAGRRSGARQQQQHQQQQGPPVPVLIDLDEEDVDGDVSPSQLSTDEAADAEPPPDLGVRAIAVGAHVLDESVEPRHAYVVCAGPDWRVRFWEGPGMRGEGSCVVSGGGSSADDDAATVAPSTYEIKGVGDAVVVEEVPGKTTTAEGSEGEAGGKKARAGKGTIVSLLQQDVLSGHKDTVLDVALLERPYGMIVSVDRAGVAYVFC